MSAKACLKPILFLLALRALHGAANLQELPLPSGERISGSALYGTTELVTWGDHLRLWNLDTGLSRTIGGTPRASYGPGGCVADVDGDGQADLVLQQGTELIWMRAPDWKAERIDTNADFRDCRGIELLGRRGILLVHRYAQVRLYERPAKPQPRWPYTELYSIYTPSRQGSIIPQDVDEDGIPDLFLGNYWMKSPASFDLPWRLFAIELYNEKADSALVRLAVAKITGHSFPELVVSEGAVDHGRLAWFERPEDPRQLWVEHRLMDDEVLHYPQGLAVYDINRDGAPDLLVGEDNGAASRLFVLTNQLGSFEDRVLLKGVPSRELHLAGDRLILVSTSRIVILPLRSTT